MQDKREKPVVLVVEDEPFILMDAVDFLTNAGFSVLESYSADNALIILEKSNAVDAIFTDVNLPGTLDGIQLCEIVAERWPRIGLVVASGKVRPTSSLPGNASFLEKPYLHEKVIAAIRAKLGDQIDA